MSADELEFWIVRDVEVATKGKPRTVKGLLHPRVPGLAVTEGDRFGVFVVTHLASGKKLAGPYERCAIARETLAALGHCADWRQDESVLAAEIKAHGDEPANVPGWTVTDKDGKRPQTKRQVVSSARNWFIGDEYPWEEESPDARATKILAALPEATELVL